MGVVKRGDVYWVSLDPTVVSEIQKTRPCLIVSPDDMNAALQSFIVASLTSGGQPLGCRPEIKFKGKAARIALYQLRSVDKQRPDGKMREQVQELISSPAISGRVVNSDFP